MSRPLAARKAPQTTAYTCADSEKTDLGFGITHPYFWAEVTQELF